ncbi:GAF domain-containing protein [Martelella limonii]|uniref:GAF domain-containing protein n=1 Tax=Martelella limonii TaxID=1647649 RepID=UPI00158024A1|nr:GAF domain-containing protein [Martelella limonii]
MLSVPLEAIRESLEGIMPSVIATSDAAGMPNISYLSQVHYIDSEHVGLSNQFFSKTAANIEITGRAKLVVLDGRNGMQHVLDLVFERSVRSGEIFERLAAQFDVMSGLQETSHMLALRAVDIYRVEECSRIDPVAPLEPVPLPTDGRDNYLWQAAAAAGALAEVGDAETLLDASLALLSERFDIGHAMILVADHETNRLVTVASRGYPHFGFGAEIAFGEGIIGVAAARRQTVRIPDLRRSRRYVSAIAASTAANREEIPVPMIEEPQSQVAVPMIAAGRLIGVVFAESEKSFDFSHDEEAVLRIIAAQVASGLVNFELADVSGEARAPSAPPQTHSGDRTEFRFQFFPHDGGVFIDNEYVIRGVPGRLLHHFVSSYVQTGRTEFSNREIRRDRRLNLPDFKDNLETRLILLRRRLEERGGPLRLERPERGQIRLVIDGRPEISVSGE